MGAYFSKSPNPDESILDQPAPEESIFFQDSIIASICENLTVEEVLQLMKAYKRETVNCFVSFQDPITHQLLYLPGINPETFPVYQSIQKIGLQETIITSIRSKNIPFLKALSKMIDINTYQTPWGTVLMTAIRFNQPEVISFLLDSGVDINVTDKDGNTALSPAAFGGDLSLVKRLLDQGANVNHRNIFKSFPLMSAVGRDEIVSLLLDRGADVNAADVHGKTALMNAVQFNDYSTVQLLLDRGANINAVNGSGQTALNQARFHGQELRNDDIIELLVSRGAI